MSNYLAVFEERREALARILGKPDGKVHVPVPPIYLGGFAEVLTFREFVDGVTYVTAGLTGGVADRPQITNSLGEYELMICTPEDEPRAADLISRLSRYTFDAQLNPGETMDCPPFRGSKIAALLFAEPELPKKLVFGGQQYGLLLCIGITGPELNAAQEGSSEELLDLLKRSGVFPFTDLRRETLKNLGGH